MKLKTPKVIATLKRLAKWFDALPADRPAADDRTERQARDEDEKIDNKLLIADPEVNEL